MSPWFRINEASYIYEYVGGDTPSGFDLSTYLLKATPYLTVQGLADTVLRYVIPATSKSITEDIAGKKYSVASHIGFMPPNLTVQTLNDNSMADVLGTYLEGVTEDITGVTYDVSSMINLIIPTFGIQILTDSATAGNLPPVPVTVTENISAITYDLSSKISLTPIPTLTVMEIIDSAITFESV